jgi:hypothetical protein
MHSVPPLDGEGGERSEPGGVKNAPTPASRYARRRTSPQGGGMEKKGTPKFVAGPSPRDMKGDGAPKSAVLWFRSPCGGRRAPLAATHALK